MPNSKSPALGPLPNPSCASPAWSPQVAPIPPVHLGVSGFPLSCDHICVSPATTRKLASCQMLTGVPGGYSNRLGKCWIGLRSQVLPAGRLEFPKYPEYVAFPGPVCHGACARDISGEPAFLGMQGPGPPSPGHSLFSGYLPKAQPFLTLLVPLPFRAAPQPWASGPAHPASAALAPSRSFLLPASDGSHSSFRLEVPPPPPSLGFSLMLPKTPVSPPPLTLLHVPCQHPALSPPPIPPHGPFPVGKVMLFII